MEVLSTATALTVVAGAAVLIGLVVTRPAPRHDMYPLHPGSAGPRVCALQWLLGGHKPSVWRSPKYIFYHYKPTCWWSKKKLAHTTVALRKMKYALGWPDYALVKPKADRFFIDVLQGKIRRPKTFVERAVKRSQIPEIRPYAFGAPLSRKPTICGVPGVGTHSYLSYPNNWQSDRAVDLCVAYGTPVLAVANGYICTFCGYGPGGVGRFAGQRFTLNLVGGDQVYYAHLSRLSVYRGMRVNRGTLLGYSGAANGVNHLHISCRVCNPYTLAK